MMTMIIIWHYRETQITAQSRLTHSHKNSIQFLAKTVNDTSGLQTPYNNYNEDPALSLTR